MRRLLLAAVVLAVLPSTATAAGFKYGVSAAEVTSNSALLWGSAPKAGKVELVLARGGKFGGVHVMLRKVNASKASDLTVQSRIGGLKPGTLYKYYFHLGKQRSDVGTFTTAPKPGAAKTIRFAVTGDADGVKRADGKN